jgi:hypothetical protein
MFIHVSGMQVKTRQRERSKSYISSWTVITDANSVICDNKITENMELNRVRLHIYVCMCEERNVTYLAKCRNLKELFKMWLDFTLSCNGFKYFF